ncbi:hypothetical protein BDD12DRAFT_880694 [Trichophaea hybrida]|nr:hypothetical protein BDD12DRAFT_880694 [Trichophaea hybrida]
MSSQSLSDFSGREGFLPLDVESEFSTGGGSFDSNAQAVSTSPTSTHPLPLSPSNAFNSSIASKSSPAAHRNSCLTSLIHALVLEVLLLFDEVFEWRYNEAGPPFKKIPFYKEYPWSSIFANYLQHDNGAKFDKQQFSQKVADEMLPLWIIYANIPFCDLGISLYLFCEDALFGLVQTKPVQSQTASLGPGPV